jgi:hypothetical protein
LPLSVEGSTFTPGSVKCSVKKTRKRIKDCYYVRTGFCYPKI